MSKRMDAATLVVDPIKCTGIGMCAFVAPELVELDEWGFPILPSEPVVGRDARAAERAVAGCARRALLLVEGR